MKARCPFSKTLINSTSDCFAYLLEKKKGKYTLSIEVDLDNTQFTLMDENDHSTNPGDDTTKRDIYFGKPLLEKTYQINKFVLLPGSGNSTELHIIAKIDGKVPGTGE